MEPGKIIGLAIGLFVLSAIMPVAVTALFGVNTSSWDATTVALWNITPIVVVAGIIYAVYKGTSKK